MFTIQSVLCKPFRGNDVISSAVSWETTGKHFVFQSLVKPRCLQDFRLRASVLACCLPGRCTILIFDMFSVSSQRASWPSVFFKFSNQRKDYGQCGQWIVCNAGRLWNAWLNTLYYCQEFLSGQTVMALCVRRGSTGICYRPFFVVNLLR